MSRYGKQVTELLCRARSGNQRAWEELFNTTYNHLRGVAYHYLIDKNSQTDVVMEAFGRAYRYTNTFKSSEDGYNWLCKLVQNVAATYNVKLIKENSLTLKDMPVSVSEDSVYDKIERAEIRRMLKTLDEKEQLIIYYRFWEQRTYEEIAQLLDMKKTTVFDAEKRILEKLLKKF